ncbi:hypothetical protein OIE73_30890 [Streptomyces hirsutus]|uniref:Uncharacterized protein n=1 Tax=Streptomyces hirsutus TaxID=35620 RepID=A0ABZ1GWP1_9ACTN|nr:hypothetical protein [Streptomyces hirsutus]WSD09707.1 hypothetical protein OIE73_30890 [Streptomyces hirsutus]
MNEATRPDDVTVVLLAGPFTVAGMVLDHLMVVLPWSAGTRERARA